VNEQPDVTAVVLNYNGRPLLEVILPSLASQSYRRFEVLVVDNGSRDDSMSYLSEHWPDVEVVTIPDNIGVAAALNRGVAGARREFVALLNNDLELEPDWLEAMRAGLDRHPEAAAVACKLRSYQDRERLDGAGDVLTRSLTAYRRGHGELDHGQYDSEQEVFAATAGGGLYRAAVLAQVGPFDESFFAYYEDVDWGLRAQLAGLRSWYIPTAVAYHMGSHTTGGDSNPYYYEIHRRNTLAVLIKDVPARVLLRNAHSILHHHALGLVYSARAGMLRVHLRAIFRALRAAPGWLRARRRILGSRAIDARDFDRFLGAPEG
jgi:GT2 family glycosyltransferase